MHSNTRSVGVRAFAAHSCRALIAIGMMLGLRDEIHAQYFQHVAAQYAGDGSPRALASAPDASGGTAVAPASGQVLYTGHLTVRYTTEAEKVGSLEGMALWRANTPPGWVRLGDTITTSAATKGLVLIAKDDPTYLAPPVKFEWSGVSWLWWPVPPPGFVTLGWVAGKGSKQNEPPDLALYRCVRADLVLPGRFERIGPQIQFPGGWRRAYYTVKYDGPEAFIPANLFHWACWFEPTSAHPHDQPYVPDNGQYVDDAGGRYHPALIACDPWVLKGLTGDEIYADVLGGVKQKIEALLEGSGAGLADKLTTHAALKPHFSDVAARITTAATTAQAPRPAAAATLESATPKPQPGPISAVSFAPTAFYSGPAPTPPAPSPTSAERTWNPGGTFAADNTSPTRTLTDVPGLSGIPFLQSVQLTDAIVTQGSIASGAEANQPYLIARGNVAITFGEPIGRVEGRAIVLSRLFKETGVHTGLLVLVPTDRLRDVAHFNDTPINQLGLPATVGVTFGTVAHQWENAELPANVRAELAAVFPAAFPVRFRKDVAIPFKAALNQSGQLDTVLGSVSTEFLFTAILKGPTNDKFRVVSEPVGDFKPGFLPPGLELCAPAFDLVPGEMDIGLTALLKLNLADMLKAELPLRLGLGSTVSVSGDLPGTWTNPLHIPSLKLDEMKFAGGLGVGAPNLNLKARAQFLGKAMDMAGGFTFGPLALSMFSAEGVNLTLHDLIGFQEQLIRAANPPQLPSFTIDVPDNLIELRNATVTVAAQAVPSMNVEQGTTVSGELFVAGGKVGAATVGVSPSNGLRIEAQTSAFALGPIALTGAGGNGGPTLHLLYWPVKDPPYDLRQHCYLKGQARVAGALLNALVVLDRSKAAVNLEGKVAGVFEASLTGSADGVIDDLSKLKEMQVTARFSESVLDELQKRVTDVAGNNDAVKLAMKLVGTIFRIKSIEFTTPYATLDAGGNVELRVACSILGADVTVKPTLPLTGLSYDSLAAELAKEVTARAGDFKAPWDVAWASVETAAKAAAEATKAAYETTSKEVGAAMQTALRDAADATTKMADMASKAGEAAANVGRAVIGQVGDAGRRLGLW